jgi:hypothetical protein
MKKAMNERNLKEGQWEERKQWSLGVGQRKKSSETDIYTFYSMHAAYPASFVYSDLVMPTAFVTEYVHRIC